MTARNFFTDKTKNNNKKFWCITKFALSLYQGLGNSPTDRTVFRDLKIDRIMTQVEIARRNLEIRIKKAEAEIEAMKKRFEADCKEAQMDVHGGIYDKWYRNHRSDHGEAYDAAWWDEYRKTELPNGFQFING